MRSLQCFVCALAVVGLVGMGFCGSAGAAYNNLFETDFELDVAGTLPTAAPEDLDASVPYQGVIMVQDEPVDAIQVINNLNMNVEDGVAGTNNYLKSSVSYGSWTEGSSSV